MFFGSVGYSLLTIQGMLLIFCSTHQQAFCFQTLISVLGSRKVWSLTPPRKHVLQAKKSLGQTHHICVRLFSQYNWCSPYICWCFDTGEVRKSFRSITEPAKIQKYMASDQNHLQNYTLTARNWHATLPVLLLSTVLESHSPHGCSGIAVTGGPMQVAELLDTTIGSFYFCLLTGHHHSNCALGQATMGYRASGCHW